MYYIIKNVGGLKCEMEMINDQGRKEQVLTSLKALPKDAELIEKKFKINNLEQVLFLSFDFLLFLEFFIN
jgi:hypothetical protein